MLGGWLFPSIRGVLAERIRTHQETKIERKMTKLQRKISRLDVKAAKLDYLAKKCQFKSQGCLSWPQKKWERKAERLTRKVAKLQGLSKSQGQLHKADDDDEYPEFDTAGIWVKDARNDITVLPPTYDDIYYQQPPPYDSNDVTKKISLYPTLM